MALRFTKHSMNFFYFFWLLVCHYKVVGDVQKKHSSAPSIPNEEASSDGEQIATTEADLEKLHLKVEEAKSKRRARKSEKDKLSSKSSEFKCATAIADVQAKHMGLKTHKVENNEPVIEPENPIFHRIFEFANWRIFPLGGGFYGIKVGERILDDGTLREEKKSKKEITFYVSDGSKEYRFDSVEEWPTKSIKQIWVKTNDFQFDLGKHQAQVRWTMDTGIRGDSVSSLPANTDSASAKILKPKTTEKFSSESSKIYTKSLNEVFYNSIELIKKSDRNTSTNSLPTEKFTHVDLQASMKLLSEAWSSADVRQACINSGYEADMKYIDAFLKLKPATNI